MVPPSLSHGNGAYHKIRMKRSFFPLPTGWEVKSSLPFPQQRVDREGVQLCGCTSLSDHAAGAAAGDFNKSPTSPPFSFSPLPSSPLPPAVPSRTRSSQDSRNAHVLLQLGCIGSQTQLGTATALLWVFPASLGADSGAVLELPHGS